MGIIKKIGKFFKNSACWLLCKLKIEKLQGPNPTEGEGGFDITKDCSHCWDEK